MSIASFVAEQVQHNPAPWEPTALNRFSVVLVVLAVAVGLATQRRLTRWTLWAQLVTAAATVAFAAVALAKLYMSPGSRLSYDQALSWSMEAVAMGGIALAFGLIGLHVWTSKIKAGFVGAACIALGCGIYGLSLEWNLSAQVWYAVVTAAALLASSAAATRDH